MMEEDCSGPTRLARSRRPFGACRRRHAAARADMDGSAPHAFVAAAFVALIVGARYRRRTYHVSVATTAAARLHDAAISHLVRSSFPEQLGEDEDASEDVMSDLSGFHDLETCEWLLAFCDGKLVGMAMVVAYHDSLYVASLCVLHAHRGRGVGARIMRTASALAASRGLAALSGSVFGGSARLVSFYVSLGGQLEADHSIVAPGSSVVAAKRLRAPSGPQTALDVPPPPSTFTA